MGLLRRGNVVKQGGRKIKMPPGWTTDHPMVSRATTQLDDLERTYPQMAGRVSELDFSRPLDDAVAITEPLALGRGSRIRVTPDMPTILDLGPGPNPGAQSAMRTYEDVITHEFGHAVNTQIARGVGTAHEDNAVAEVLNLPHRLDSDFDHAVHRAAKAIESPYASTNASELFAEMFLRANQPRDLLLAEGVSPQVVDDALPKVLSKISTRLDAGSDLSEAILGTTDRAAAARPATIESLGRPADRWFHGSSARWAEPVAGALHGEGGTAYGPGLYFTTDSELALDYAWMGPGAKPEEAGGLYELPKDFAGNLFDTEVDEMPDDLVRYFNESLAVPVGKEEKLGDLFRRGSVKGHMRSTVTKILEDNGFHGMLIGPESEEFPDDRLLTIFNPKGQRLIELDRDLNPIDTMGSPSSPGFWSDTMSGFKHGWASAEDGTTVHAIGGRQVKRFGRISPDMEGNITGQLDEMEALFPGTRVESIIMAQGEYVPYVGGLKDAPNPANWSASMGVEKAALSRGETLAVNTDALASMGAGRVPAGQAAHATARETIQHEFGHHVHNTILGVSGKVNPNEWDPHLLGILSEHFGEEGDGAQSLVQRVSRSIGSQYAATDAREAFPEVFTRGMQGAERRAADGIDEVTSGKIDDFMVSVQRRAAEAAGYTGELPELDWLPSRSGKAYPPVIDANGGVKPSYSHLPPPPTPVDDPWVSFEPTSPYPERTPVKPPIETPKPKPTPRPVPPKPIEQSVEDTTEVLTRKGKTVAEDVGELVKRGRKSAPKLGEEATEFLSHHGAKLTAAGAIAGGVGLLIHFNKKRKESHQATAQVVGDFGGTAAPTPSIPIQTSLGDQNRQRRMGQMMNARQRAGSFLNTGTSTARNGLAVRTNQF